MPEFLTAASLMVILAASAAFGAVAYRILPEGHRSRETLDFIRLVASLLVTFAALVLGLLTASVKNSFDATAMDFSTYSAEIIILDQELRQYGPEADPARSLLRDYGASVISSTWPEEAAPAVSHTRAAVSSDSEGNAENLELGNLLEQIEARIRGLHRDDEMRQEIARSSLDALVRIVQLRWKLIGEAHSTISMPFYRILQFWLAAVFASFGLSAPRNWLAAVAVALAAVSVAAAIFVILELDGPLDGFIKVSSEPMRVAMNHLNR